MLSLLLVLFVITCITVVSTWVLYVICEWFEGEQSLESILIEHWKHVCSLRFTNNRNPHNLKNPKK